MKKTILLSVSALLSMMVSAQTVERMDSLKPEQKAMAVSLKLTGRLSASANGDYRQMRDLCFQVRTIDLGDAQSTEIPKNAFHSRHQLVNITLPASCYVQENIAISTIQWPRAICPKSTGVCRRPHSRILIALILHGDTIRSLKRTTCLVWLERFGVNVSQHLSASIIRLIPVP